jgi:hypothetical protein
MNAYLIINTAENIRLRYMYFTVQQFIYNKYKASISQCLQTDAPFFVFKTRGIFSD